MSYFKFKPGDRVRVIEHEDNWTKVPVGVQGTVADHSRMPIVSLDKPCKISFVLTDDSGNIVSKNACVFCQEELELIEGGQNV